VKPTLQPIRTPRCLGTCVRPAPPCSPSSSIIRHSSAKRDPFFSISCTLFSIRSFVHPHYFIAIAHSLPKTPRGGCNPGRFNQFLVTPIESYSFARITPNPNGILLFHRDPGGGGCRSLAIINFRGTPRPPSFNLAAPSACYNMDIA